MFSTTDSWFIGRENPNRTGARPGTAAESGRGKTSVTTGLPRDTMIQPPRTTRIPRGIKIKNRRFVAL
jgi:hypothetical protein